MSVRGWRFAFDWSRAGTYTGPLEDVSGYLTDDDLVTEVGRVTTQAAAALTATTMAFTLTDITKVFAPESPTSPALNANPHFETNIADWTGFGGAIVQTNFLPFGGLFCMKLTPDGVSATARTECGQVLGASPGQSWRGDSAVKCEVSRNVTANINWFNSAGTYLSTTNGAATPLTANVWGSVTVTGTAPANAARASLSIDMTGTPPATNVLYLDAATLATVGLLAGDVVPGVPAVLDLTIGGSTTPLYAGVLDDFDYNPDALEMSGTVTDAWGKPGAESLSTSLYQGMRTGDLIGVVLDEIGWTGSRDIDPGATLVPFWWAEGKDAATAIQELVDSEGPPAIAYVEAGTFVFRDRHHRYTDAASLTSQGTFTHIFPPGTGPSGDFKALRGSFNYNHGRKNIVNSATFQVDIRRPKDLAQVWTTDSPISIPASTSVNLFISTTDPFFYAQTPVSTPVFPMEDGTLAPDMVVTSGTVTAAIDRTSGASMILTLTAGGTDAVVDSLAVRAVPIPVAQTVKVSAEDIGSVRTKGALSWGRPLPWAGVYDAYAIAQHIVSVYAVARPVLTFTIDGGISAAYLAQFAARKVSDRVTVRHDIIGLNEDLYVEKIIRTVKALGARGAHLTMICEAADPTGAVNPLTFDVAGKGFNDGQFQADGIDNPSTVFRFDVAGHGFNDGRFAS